ncbi:MAG TPA: hypothetical protein VII56_13500 [Rhizomicrobium sp.]
MSRFKVITGDLRANARRGAARSTASEQVADDIVAADVGVLEAYGERDNNYDAAPLEEGYGPRNARDLYLIFASEMPSSARRTDFRIPGEFHALLWLIVRLGAVQQFIARDQAVPVEVVSRWTSAKQTPAADKRRGIILSALKSLEIGLDEKTLVPLTNFTGRRAYVSDKYPANTQ